MPIIVAIELCMYKLYQVVKLGRFLRHGVCGTCTCWYAKWICLQGVDIFVNSVFADVVRTEDDSRHILLGLCRQCYTMEKLQWITSWHVT